MITVIDWLKVVCEQHQTLPTIFVSEVKRSIESVNTPVEWYETEGLSTYRECEY